MLGAKSVIATDNVPPVLALLSENVKRNLDDGKVQVKYLEWEDEGESVDG